MTYDIMQTILMSISTSTPFHSCTLLRVTESKVLVAGLVVYGILAVCAYFSGVKWLAPVLLCWPEALDITYNLLTGFAVRRSREGSQPHWERYT